MKNQYTVVKSIYNSYYLASPVESSFIIEQEVFDKIKQRLDDCDMLLPTELSMGEICGKHSDVYGNTTYFENLSEIEALKILTEDVCDTLYEFSDYVDDVCVDNDINNDIDVYQCSANCLNKLKSKYDKIEVIIKHEYVDQLKIFLTQVNNDDIK